MENAKLSSAFQDTLMFIMGAVIGQTIECSIIYLNRRIDIDRRPIVDKLIFGILQILINAIIVIRIKMAFPQLGFFSFGLFSTQDFRIKNCYPSKNLISS